MSKMKNLEANSKYNRNNRSFKFSNMCKRDDRITPKGKGGAMFYETAGRINDVRGGSIEFSRQTKRPELFVREDQKKMP
jgi:hypothetical protein